MLSVFVLSGNNFTGSLPLSIRNLSMLSDLDLSENHFTKSLPSSIGNLSKLTYLLLNENNITGSRPPSIENLSKLTYLFLFGNHFTGSLPPSIRNLSKLTYLLLKNLSMLTGLDLSSNHLIRSLPPSIGNDFMELSSNRFQGQLIHTASHPQGLQLLYNYRNFSGNTRLGLGQKFEMLNISSSTNLRRQICKSMKLLPGFLKHYTSTVTIREVACYDLVTTTETYAKLPNLEQLDLSNNQISGCILENIGEVMQNLWILDLSSNSISGFIPNSTGNMEGLTVLHFYKNKLMGPIPTSMGNLKNLRTLVLRGNKLSEQIPSSLKNCTQLEGLDLGDNQLSRNLPSWIGQNLISLLGPFLRLCQVYTRFKFSMLLKIASQALSTFTAMKVTEKMADYNYDRKYSFYYMVSIYIVAKGSMMDYTEFLSLGRIPESLTKLIGLRVLNLSGNHMIGKIPQEINQLQELESMDLSNNLFSGGIPLSMSSMKYLGTLNLSYNNLSGPIPFAGHMSTFNDASTYYGNENLCGPPLPTKCDSPISNNGGDLRTGSPKVRQFWISAGLRFGNGFGGWYLVLAIKRKWNNAILKVMDFIAEILITRLQHLFPRRNR
ncbi:hypothetical protein AMTRI_Chr07g30240 [Amborella trichopoda]